MTGAFYGFEKHKTVPDPDLRYAGAPVIQTLRKGGGEGGLPKKFVLAFWASVWSKNKGGGTGPQPPPLDPPLQENLPVQ